MLNRRDQFVYAGSKAVSNSLAGPAWPVYEEYEIERRDGGVFIYAPFRSPLPDPALRTKPRQRPPEDVGLKRYYAPLRDYPDLFLRFAAISRKGPFTEEAMLEVVLSWAKDYGVLGMEGIDYLEIPGHRDYRMGRRESLAAFWEEVLNAARVLRMYEASTASGFSEKNLKETLRAWGFLVKGQSLEQQRELALSFVGDEVCAYVSRECHPVLYRTVTGDGRTMGFAHGFGFDSLLGAMYLQMMWLMTEGSVENVRRCGRPGCSRIISFEPPQPDSMRRGASGKYRTRKDKKYCSSACKQWVYDNTRKQGSP